MFKIFTLLIYNIKDIILFISKVINNKKTYIFIFALLNFLFLKISKKLLKKMEFIYYFI